MGGGLALGPGSPKRKLGGEFPQIQNLYKEQEQDFTKFLQSDPLLGLALPEAQSFSQNLGSLTAPLQSMFGQASPAFSNLFNSTQSGFGGIQGNLSKLFGNASTGFGNLLNSVIGGSNQLFNQAGGNLKNWQNTFNKDVLPILQTGGKLTGAQERDVSQATAAQFGAQGNIGGNQEIGALLQNRQNAQEQRLNTALGQGQAIQGIESGITGQQAGIRANEFGQEAGILGQELGVQSGLLGQEAGTFGQEIGALTGAETGTGVLPGLIQGLQSGGLNQLLTTGQAGSGIFANLTDPLLGYAQNLFGGNQAAQLSTQQANQNKASGLAAGGASSSSSVLSSLALAGVFSDKRLKENIKSTGEKTPDGIPIKTFNFKHDPDSKYVGVIAQDVEKYRPDAVREDQTGLKHVHLPSIGAPYHRIGRGGRGRNDGIEVQYFGPVDNDKNPDANFALHGSGTRRDRHGRRQLDRHDIALSPDLLRRFPLGSDVEIHGNRYHVGDVSYRGPGRPNRNVIEFRDHKNHPGRLSFNDISGGFGDRFAGGRRHRHGFRQPGLALGGSGFPRAIAVGGRRGGGDRPTSLVGGGPSTVGGFGGNNPGQFASAGYGLPSWWTPGDSTLSGSYGGPGGSTGGPPVDMSGLGPDTGPNAQGVPLFLDPNAEWEGGGIDFGGDLIHLNPGG